MQVALNTSLRAGCGTQIVRSPNGMLVAFQNGTWNHPWTVSVYWWPQRKEWEAIVRPGFVNGQAPKVHTTAARMAETPSFLAPITAWDGAADIAQAAELADDSTQYSQDGPIWVPLYRNPFISIPGWMPLTEYPVYFTRRGVAADGTRQLVSCDVVLHKPRNALTSDVTIPADLVLGSSIVTQTLGVTSDPSDRLRVFCIPQIQTETADQITADQILGTYEEPMYDELLLATIYLLSPPNATGAADGSWTAFVAHKVFWNLSWDQPALGTLATDAAGTQYIPPLAGGAGSLVTNSIIASLNDATNDAINMTTAHSLAGAFWTPTGGGSTYAFPAATTAAQDNFGLSKSARTKAAKAAAIAAGVWVDTLDPVFPYNANAFQLTTLNFQ